MNKQSLTVEVELKAHVPQLMRAALKIARGRCEYVKVRDCSAVLDERDWCAPCRLRAAVRRDLVELHKRAAGEQPSGKRGRRGWR